MTKRKLLLATTILSVMPLLAIPAYAAEMDSSEISALRNENMKLQKELSTLMSRLDKIEARANEAVKKADKAATIKTSTKNLDASKIVTVDDNGAFVIPGTGTTVKLGGYAKLDVVHDLTARPASSGSSTAADSVDFTAIPTSADSALGSRKNATRIDARETRINLATSTPTDFGPVKTFVEFDFYGANGTALLTNSYSPRLRQAYGTIGNWLIGQTWSNYIDSAAAAEVLDFGGPAGGTTMRQAQVRYTYNFGGGHVLATSIENPESDFTTASGATSTNSINHYPDLIAAYKYSDSWGSFSLRGVLRNIAFDSGKPAASPTGKESVWGYGLAAGLKYKPFSGDYAKDGFHINAQAGKGIGRYLLEAVNLGAAVDSTNQLKALQAFGGNVGYQHFWTDTLRSSVVYGMTRINVEDFMAAATTRRIDSVHANLIWSPVPSVDVGAEYIYGFRKVKNGASGEMNRVQGSVKYKF